MPTDESKPPVLSSIYALNKFEQERSALLFGRAYEIPTVALRFFNVYGPHQALSNPYTGVLAIFAARLLNDKLPMIFEDGEQRRDFVSVNDAAGRVHPRPRTPRCRRRGDQRRQRESVTVREIAVRLAKILGKEHVAPQVTGECRLGDISHCFADVDKARGLLGFEPGVSLEQGMTELAGWLEGQVADDRVEHARSELRSRGLTV